MNHYEDDFCEETCKPTSIGNELGEVLQNIKLNENLLHETVSILGVRLQPILKKQHLKDTDKVKSDVDDISEDCADLIFSLKVHSNHLINTIRQIEDLNNLLCL